MNYFCLILTCLVLSGCTAPVKRYTAPADIPKPRVKINADKMNSNILSIGKNIGSANLRAEKIKVLLGDLDQPTQ